MKLQFVCDFSDFVSFPVCLLVYYMYQKWLILIGKYIINILQLTSIDLLVHILVDPVCDRVSPCVVIESHLLCGCQVIGSHTHTP